MTPDEPAFILSEEDQKSLLNVAKEVLRLAVTEGPEATAKAKDLPLPDIADQVLGVFVTLSKDSKLRGCQGVIEAKNALINNIILSTKNAALKDTRFSPVTPDELDRLTIEINILSPFKASNLDDFLLGRDGIMMIKDGKSALFLPSVPACRGWSLTQTLKELSKKAKLPEDAWKEGARFETFTSTCFEAPYLD